MSDQISENMARKLARQVADYTCDKQADQFDAEARCMRAWRSADLIKKSALDEAREWCLDTQNMATVYQVDVIQALQTLREKYELAITEILEERE
jgi:hypothetical protein